MPLNTGNPIFSSNPGVRNPPRKILRADTVCPHKFLIVGVRGDKGEKLLFFVPHPSCFVPVIHMVVTENVCYAVNNQDKESLIQGD
jgi:hypothetical protein